MPFVICAELRVTAQRERQSSDLAYAWGALRKLDEPVGCHARLQRLRITIESIASMLHDVSRALWLVAIYSAQLAATCHWLLVLTILSYLLHS